TRPPRLRRARGEGAGGGGHHTKTAPPPRGEGGHARIPPSPPRGGGVKARPTPRRFRQTQNGRTTHSPAPPSIASSPGCPPPTRSARSRIRVASNGPWRRATCAITTR